jgi:ATP-dependent RNA helicase RhlE
VPAGPQDRALRAAVDVVVATPGRLLDHLGSGTCRFDALEVLVLDEADRMLDMGFWPSVRRIVAGLPAARQTLFFSATMSPDVYSSAMQIMREPKMVTVGGGGSVATTITHFVHRIGHADKAAWLAKFLRASRESAIVFVRTKRGADRLAERLARLGIRCAALHADRSQSQRTAAIEGFKAGKYTTLVATDVAARGLDIDSVGYVVNVEVPDTTDTYVHRVGRTGRAQTAGKALTLVSRDDEEALHSLERALGVPLVELEPSRNEAAIAS